MEHPASTDTFLDALRTGIAIVDEDGEIVYANTALAQRLNIATDDDTIGRSIIDLIGGIPLAQPETAQILNRQLRDVGESALTFNVAADRAVTLYIGAREVGPRVIVAATGWPSSDDASTNLIAQVDPLTGFGNRLLYEERIRTFSTSNDRDLSVAVLVIDLDNFKQVNDSLGHGTGDELLTLVARRIRTCTRSADTLVRQGGDEFAVVLSQKLSREHIGALSQRLVTLLGQPFLVNGHQVNIGASIGIAALGDLTNNVHDLLKHADLALYEAKRLGRSRYAFFEPRLEEQALDRRSFELDLRRALGLRQFSLFYQPQTSIAENRVVGFEALLRWDHPVRGRVPPDEFIPFAEKIGEIITIGSWVIRSACEEAMRWADQTLCVAVNVSPAQFTSDALIHVIRDALDKTGLAPERLEIEITEGLLLDQSKDVMARLWAIKHLGVSVAMDDFGTGYSSLSFLNSFPFSKIKIDKSFIQADDSPRSKALVSGILSMGISLGMTTIAEGVETSHQYSEIAKGGCSIAQGYLIAKPMPASEIAGFLESFTLLDVLVCGKS
jgi:diguanylate cyclase (GGDEF)-like protein